MLVQVSKILFEHKVSGNLNDITECRFHDTIFIDGDRGENYPKSEDFYANGFCLFLNAGNVTKQGFSFENMQFISKEKNSSLRKI